MKKNGIFSRLFVLLCFLFLYAPILVLVVFSFNASKSKAVWAGFTLDWYVELFHNGMILNALWVTLAVSALAAVLSTIMGSAATSITGPKNHQGCRWLFTTEVNRCRL